MPRLDLNQPINEDEIEYSRAPSVPCCLIRWALATCCLACAWASSATVLDLKLVFQTAPKPHHASQRCIETGVADSAKAVLSRRQRQ
jgi:hypothetical protein